MDTLRIIYCSILGFAVGGITAYKCFKLGVDSCARATAQILEMLDADFDKLRQAIKGKQAKTESDGTPGR